MSTILVIKPLIDSTNCGEFGIVDSINTLDTFMIFNSTLDSLSINNSTACNNCQFDLVATLTLLMLAIMVLQLCIQRRDSKKTSKRYENYLNEQNKNTDKIVKSIHSGNIARIVEHTHDFQNEFRKLCEVLVDSIGTIYEGRSLAHDSLEKTDELLDLIRNLMRYHEIESLNAETMINSLKNDIQLLKENNIPSRTYRGIAEWIRAFNEKGNNFIENANQLFSNIDYSNR